MNKSKKFFILSLVSAFVFLAIALSIFIVPDLIFAKDQIIGESLKSLRSNETALQTLNLITNFGSIKFITSLSILIAGIMLLKNKKRVAKYFLAVLFFGAGSAYVLKEIIRRPRPEVFLGFIESGFSFPSAHAMLSVLFYGFIAYYFIKKPKPKSTKALIVSALTVLVVLICLSRVALGVHWGSDVFGGIFAGLAILFAIIGFYEKKGVTP